MNVDGLLVPPADDRPLDAILMLRPHVEEAGSLRRAEPLVAVPCIEIRAERLEVERNLAGSVRAVDDGDEAGLAAAAHDLVDREQHARRRRDVGRVHDARPLGAGGEERLDDVADRQRRLHPDVASARSLRRSPPRRDRSAPYSSPVASTSSPGWRSSERAAMFTPVVVFWTKVRSSGAAPT